MTESDYKVIVMQALRAILADQPDTGETVRIRRVLTGVIEELTMEEE